MRHNYSRIVRSLFMLAAALTLAPAASRAGAVKVIAKSTFDSSLDGWSSSNSPASQVTWDSSGGNPDGYAKFVDAGDGVTYLVAPTTATSKWIGNYLAEGLNGGVLSFDHKIFSSGTGDTYNKYEVMLSGPGGSATWTGETAAVTDFKTPWVTVDVPLNPSNAGWMVTSGSWRGLLQDVTSLEIRMELVDNNHPGASDKDTEGIDNIYLKSVPEPAGLTLAGLSLLGAGVARWRSWRKRPLAVA